MYLPATPASRLITICIVAAIGLLAPLVAQDDAAPAAEEVPELLPPAGTGVEGGFVLIELFTSEGCSSCPRADHFANLLAREARQKQLPVFPIAWHVDYWNKLKTKHGVWVDPYSDAAYTKRQKAYGVKVPVNEQFKGRLVTPQFIINARHQRRDKEQPFPEFFKQLLALAPAAQLQAGWKSGDTADTLTWTVEGASDDAELLVLVVESALTSQITKGENHGKTLEHENVVRKMQRIDLGEQRTGELAIALPEDGKREHSSVVLIVQRRGDLTVEAVRGLPLAEAVDDRQSRLDPPGFAAPDPAADCKDGVCVLPEAETP